MMNKHFFSFILNITLFAILFTSCKKEEDGEKDLITGTIVTTGDWTNVGVSFDFGNNWAATSEITTVASTKRFSIELPVPKAEYLEPISSGLFGLINMGDMFQASETIIDYIANRISEKMSNQNSKGSVAVFYVYKASEKEIISLTVPTTVSVIQYVYVDLDVSTSGEFQETVEDVPVKFEFNMDLKKGWNTVHALVNPLDAIAGIASIALKTADVPLSGVWMPVGN